MKIAVTAEGPTLESQIDGRFGRCPYFLIVDPADMSLEPIANPFIERQGGAGIQAGKLMADRGVQVVLTGRCGVNATEALSVAGIRIVADCTGTVRQAIERFKTGGSGGDAQPAPAPAATTTEPAGNTAAPKPSAGQSTPVGMGMAWGRRAGGGGGQGRRGGGGGGRRGQCWGPA